jgi:uncharacterized membrane protein YozB (DUF420 family)
MREFWSNTSLLFALLTFAIGIFFWDIGYDPIERRIMVLANLVFTIFLVWYAYKVKTK